MAIHDLFQHGNAGLGEVRLHYLNAGAGRALRFRSRATAGFLRRRSGGFMSNTPVPFELHVGDDVLADLKARLTRVRWPDEVPDNRWKYGTDLPYLRSLVEYWRDGYDWRKHEAKLNSFKQYKVKLAGIDLHFIREEGKEIGR